MASSPPTTEQGRVSDRTGIAGAGLLPWSQFSDSSEYVPELQWPGFIPVCDRMMGDAQVDGLSRAVSLPVQRRAWCLDPNGASPESVERLADELGLPILGQDSGPRRRRRGRFSFRRHLVDATRALWYGHYYFEQVGRIDGNNWVLSKLAPRPPRTIAEINVADDGGLVSIKQALGYQSPELPVDRLVAYVWDQEAGNWAGRSMLRPLYRNWLIKDRLLRVDAIKHERGANGAPVIEAPPGSTPAQIEELAAMAQAMKITERGGGAVPAGAKLAGNSGPTSTDTIASVQFHNQEMASAFLAMFQQLGQTQTGSRALGDTFVDFFSLALDAVCEWVMDVFNQHVIEDWYDWNYGEESQPCLLAIEEEPDPAADVAPLQSEIDKGNVDVAPEDAAQVGAPAQASARSRARRGRRRRGGSTVAAESPQLKLPPRNLRRQPYDHEIMAKTDYAAIDSTLDTQIDSTVSKISRLQAEQIAELHDQIVDAGGDLRKLSGISATPRAEAAIKEAMGTTAKAGIEGAVEEARLQGVTKPTKALVSDLSDQIAARAAFTDNLLASGLSDAAKRQAVRFTGEGSTAADVASRVSQYLTGLSDQYLKDQMNGALTQAMNDGRRAVMNRNQPKRIYSSELLDENTCSACTDIDGTEYSSVDDTIEDYPTGGYVDCQGMERCRGTLVAVYEEADPSGS